MAFSTFLNKARHARRGQALVELALIVPVLLMLVLGVVEFGRVFNAFLTVQHAAREGARIGILGATDAEIEARVLACAPTLDPAELTVVIAPGEGSRTSGTIMSVSVGYSFKVVVPILSSLLGAAIPVASTLSMRVE